jgi:hypothetical protein
LASGVSKRRRRRQGFLSFPLPLLIGTRGARDGAPPSRRSRGVGVGGVTDRWVRVYAGPGGSGWRGGLGQGLDGIGNFVGDFGERSIRIGRWRGYFQDLWEVYKEIVYRWRSRYVVSFVCPT